jgi:hypothetical protein
MNINLQVLQVPSHPGHDHTIMIATSTLKFAIRVMLLFDIVLVLVTNIKVQLRVPLRLAVPTSS